MHIRTLESNRTRKHILLLVVHQPIGFRSDSCCYLNDSYVKVTYQIVEDILNVAI